MINFYEFFVTNIGGMNKILSFNIFLSEKRKEDNECSSNDKLA